MSAGIAALGKDEIRSLSEDEKGIDAECHFCNKKYHFTSEEILSLL